MRNIHFYTFTLLLKILLTMEQPLRIPAMLLETPRILGGVQAERGKNPWVISLHAARSNKRNETSYSHVCGGAIADEVHILTAAHCVFNKKPAEFLVLAGAHNIKINESSQQRVKVSQIITHPKYSTNEQTGPYDIAILKLHTSLKFNDRVSAVERANKNDVAVGQCYTTGWGNRFPLSDMYYQGSDTLTTSKSTMISASECRNAYPTLKDELKTAICSRSGFSHGTCQGDSGGPLICNRDKDKSLYLAGVVSFGFRICNNGYHPDVFTDMAHPAIFNFVESYLKDGKVDEGSLGEEKIVKDPTSSTRSVKGIQGLNTVMGVLPADTFN